MLLEEKEKWRERRKEDERMFNLLNFFIASGARRSQTTKGVWMARCAGIEPFTLVMDLENIDGRERGEGLATGDFRLL